MKSVALYTVILGNYDHGIPYDYPLKRMPFLNAAYFVCDDTVQCKTASMNGWKVIQLSKQNNPKQSQRRLKILQNFHPDLKFLNEYDVVIYHDGNNGPINPNKVFDCVNELDTHEIICFEHPHRTKCIDEVNTVINYRLVHQDAYNKVLNVYNENGFNDDIGLTETRVLFRKTNSVKLKEFNEYWLHLLSSNDIWRDQTFFDYCMWKTDISFKRLKNKEFPFIVNKNHIDPYRIRGVR